MILDYIKSKFVWLNILLSVVVVLLLVCGISFWLDVYTRHGQKVEVPNLVGLNIPEAELMLSDLGLKLEVIDSVYVRSLGAGEIAEQSPAVGTAVKKNRVIYLTINKATQLVAVPNVIEESARKAKSNLQNRGFVVDSIRYIDYEFDDYALQLLYKGLPVDSGAALPDGAHVVLVVGRNDGSFVIMPNLMGLSLDEAKARCSHSRVTLGNISYDVRPENEQDATYYYVVSQSETAGESVGVGKIVNIRLSKHQAVYEQEEEFF